MDRRSALFRWGLPFALTACPADPPAIEGTSTTASDDPSSTTTLVMTESNGAESTETGTLTSSGSSEASCGICESDGTSTTTGDSVASLPCVDATAVGTGQALAMLDTRDLENRSDNNDCASGAGDAWIEWTAPADGYYVFDTSGSAFDTTLSLRPGTCSDEPFIACNYNAVPAAGIGVASEISMYARAGERFVAIIDGQEGARGLAVLNIHPTSCPAMDILDLASTIVVEGTLTESAVEPLTTCGGLRTASVAYRLESTVPSGALYQFRVTSSDFDPLIAIDEAPVCGRNPVQCSTGFGSGSAEVVKQLYGSSDGSLGNVVTIAIDGQGGVGDFVLSIDKLPVSCPQAVAAPAEPLFWFVTGNIDDFDHQHVPSCGPSRAANGAGEFEPVPSASIALDVTPDTEVPCRLNYWGGFPAAIAVTFDYCNAGAEVMCGVANVIQNDAFVGLPAEPVLLPYGPMVTITPLSMDRSQWFSGSFNLEVDCREPPAL